MEELVLFFENYKKVCNAYTLALSTLYFDKSTIHLSKGVSYRNDMISILAGEAFEYQTNKESLAKLEELYSVARDDLKKELKYYLRSLEMIRKLPKEVYVRYNKTLSDAEEAWMNAREHNDYSLFKDALRHNIEMQKEILTYMDKDCSDYDYLLNKYQLGMNSEIYDEFFNQVKTHLLPLIKEIAEKGTIDNSLMSSYCPIDKQKQLNEILMDYLLVDRDECYLGESQHPFTEFFSVHESRITTRYHENNMISNVFSLIHEYGHALYGLQIDEKYEGTIFRDDIGCAMHESQSRFLENHIGRNKGFWEYNYPALQKYAEFLKDVSLDDYMKMINVSKPSFIRTEADELTYPIHVLIRYEIEKEIFNGNVNYDDLETLWNDKYEEYLGIRPSCSNEGILQDIHWAMGNYGYFPTYALGSAMSAQFYNAICKEMDVEKVLANNEFDKIRDWLKVNIHRYGAYYTMDDVLNIATGEPFDSKYYIEYLTTKYKQIYNL